jgi:hypothetical protein
VTAMVGGGCGCVQLVVEIEVQIDKRAVSGTCDLAMGELPEIANGVAELPALTRTRLLALEPPPARQSVESTEDQ